MYRINFIILFLSISLRSHCQESDNFESEISHLVIERIDSLRNKMGLNSLIESPVLKKWISDQVVHENLNGEKCVLLNVTNDSINNLLLEELIRKKSIDYQIFIENHYQIVITVDESNLEKESISQKVIKKIFNTPKYRYIFEQNFFNQIGNTGLISSSVRIYNNKVYVSINIVTIGYF